MKAKLAIVNITSFIGYDSSATHVYGNLILCTEDRITIDNVTDWQISHLGVAIELEQPLTKEIAKSLDKREDDDEGLYHRMYLRGDSTNRFETDERIIEIALQKYEELNLDCSMITLFEGEKFKGTQIFFEGSL